MKILLVNIAALSQRLFDTFPGSLKVLERFEFKTPVEPVFPAVTCSAQATYTTGQSPSEHGIVANGWLFPDVGKPLFWEQNARLCQSPRIWELGAWKNALLFHQQSMGLGCQIISPRPIHKHWGGLVMATYSNPDRLQKEYEEKYGTFPLHRYWGPIASIESTKWIVASTLDVIKNENRDMVWTYIPHLDYCLQKYGPDHPRNKKELEELNGELEILFQGAEKEGFEIVVVGDYGIEPVDKVIPLALALRQAGLYKMRTVKGREYPDFLGGKVIPVVDHQVAHIYCRGVEPDVVAKELQSLKGCRVVSRHDKEYGISHDRSGHLIAIADEGHWFSYKYWEDNKKMPDYADHIAIHHKPGYDPCELFFKHKIPTSWPPKITLDESKVKGSHGVLHRACDKPLLLSTIRSTQEESVAATEVAWFLRDLVSS